MIFFWKKPREREFWEEEPHFLNKEDIIEFIEWIPLFIMWGILITEICTLIYLLYKYL